jgi:hypothetical protein
MKYLIVLLSVLSSVALAQNPLWLRYPSISPDGTQIAFTYLGDLYTVGVNGGRAMPLTGLVTLMFSQLPHQADRPSGLPITPLMIIPLPFRLTAKQFYSIRAG